MTRQGLGTALEGCYVRRKKTADEEGYPQEMEGLILTLSFTLFMFPPDGRAIPSKGLD
jgi:hypothetical protein